VTLPLPGLERLPSAWLEERAGRNLSQWFTPDPFALKVAVWGLAGSNASTILEPSAGGGALVRAARMARPSARVYAYEIDPYWARRLGAEEPSACILEADALTVKWPTVDAVVMNPPYESGRDGEFLERALEAAPRVVAILRLSALAGLRRHAGVWSRCEPGAEFALTGLAICAARPAFCEAGGEPSAGRTEFCAVRLERSRYHSPNVPQTRVEWWT
jgi:predicted RNA methylase